MPFLTANIEQSFYYPKFPCKKIIGQVLILCCLFFCHASYFTYSLFCLFVVCHSVLSLYGRLILFAIPQTQMISNLFLTFQFP